MDFATLRFQARLHGLPVEIKGCNIVEHLEAATKIAQQMPGTLLHNVHQIVQMWLSSSVLFNILQLLLTSPTVTNHSNHANKSCQAGLLLTRVVPCPHLELEQLGYESTGY